ncbi:hypothetical protein ABT065_35655 [Streptomyces sp. NPDC002764]|uniref:hypothetical protein n=1 Tax=Streptomyces sp. NPDC002764 TaxID=3154428 RepID=UPI003331A6D0
MPDRAVHQVALAGERVAAAPRMSREQDAGSPDEPLTWHGLRLETMACLLVVTLRRLGDRSFEAQCQWPRLHPLNERATAVSHHPLIIVESTRQLAMAVQNRHLRPGEGPLLEGVAVNLGLYAGAQPVESGSATRVAVRVMLSDLALQAGTLTSFRVTADYLYAGQRFATCAIRFASAPAESAPLALAPGSALLHPAAAAVGAVSEPDVLLARGPQGRLVIVPRDPAHPVLLPGRPAGLPALAVLEAGRQAVLLSSGMTARAVAGLSVGLRSPVPVRGAAVDVVPDHMGARFVVAAAGRVAATGAVTLLGP